MTRNKFGKLAYPAQDNSHIHTVYTEQDALAHMQAFCTQQTGKPCRMRQERDGVTCDCGHGLDVYVDSAAESED